MKKAQIKVFEELLQDENFKGKKALKHLLWMNTSKQKFNVGDCFIVSDPGHKVFGYPVNNFKAKVTKVTSWKDTEEWYYHLEMKIVCGNGSTIVEVYKYESELSALDRCNDNINEVGGVKSNLAESLDA